MLPLAKAIFKLEQYQDYCNSQVVVLSALTRKAKTTDQRYVSESLSLQNQYALQIVNQVLTDLKVAEVTINS